MKLQELINYLETAKNKVGGDVEVSLYDSYDDVDKDIDDIVLKGEQSLMNKNVEGTMVKLCFWFLISPTFLYITNKQNDCWFLPRPDDWYASQGCYW